ncbi:hypothetical protein ACNKHS_06665 [Shigella flexneri]
MENEADSRLVSHQDRKWQVSHGPFESDDHLGESNWSLLVQAVNNWHVLTAASDVSVPRPARLAIQRLEIHPLLVPGGGVGRIPIQTTCLSFRVPGAVAGAWAKKCQ